MGIKRIEEIRAEEIKSRAGGWLTLCEKIREARLRWLGHVERKTQEDVVLGTWKMEVSGLCKIGRPKMLRKKRQRRQEYKKR